MAELKLSPARLEREEVEVDRHSVVVVVLDDGEQNHRFAIVRVCEMFSRIVVGDANALRSVAGREDLVDARHEVEVVVVC